MTLADADPRRFGARIRSKIFLVAIGIRRLVISVSFLLPAFAQMPSGLKTAIDKTCLGCHSGAARQRRARLRLVEFRPRQPRYARALGADSRSHRKGRDAAQGRRTRRRRPDGDVAATRAVAVRGRSRRRGKERPRTDAPPESRRVRTGPERHSAASVPRHSRYAPRGSRGSSLQQGLGDARHVARATGGLPGRLRSGAPPGHGHRSGAAGRDQVPRVRHESVSRVPQHRHDSVHVLHQGQSGRQRRSGALDAPAEGSRGVRGDGPVPFAGLAVRRVSARLRGQARRRVPGPFFGAGRAPASGVPGVGREACRADDLPLAPSDES